MGGGGGGGGVEEWTGRRVLRTLVSSPHPLVKGVRQLNKTKNKCSCSSVRVNSWAVPSHRFVTASLA